MSDSARRSSSRHSLLCLPPPTSTSAIPASDTHFADDTLGHLPLMSCDLTRHNQTAATADC